MQFIFNTQQTQVDIKKHAVDLSAATYSSTPNLADFQALLTTDQAGPKNYGAGDLLQYVTPEGHLYSAKVYQDAATSLMVLEWIPPLIPSGTQFTTASAYALDFSKFRPGHVIEIVSGALAGRREMNAGQTDWVPTEIDTAYRNESGGGGGSGTEVDTLATVTGRGNVANGDVEIPNGFGLIMTDDGGQRIKMTFAADDSIVTNPA